MAKANNPQGLQGTVKGLTFVQSKRYGDHVRNPRGTFKPAVLNEAMEQSKNHLLLVNETASLLFSGIRDEHRDGTLWTRLLSALRHQLKEKNHLDVSALLNLECHAVHTLNNIMRRKWDLEITGIVKRRLHITLELSGAPRFKTKHMHAFQVSLYVIYPDLARNQLKKEIVYSDALSVTAYPNELPFVIPIPPRATAYAVFLKITGCKPSQKRNNLLRGNAKPGQKLKCRRQKSGGKESRE